MFLKQKNSGKTKGWGYADGRPHAHMWANKIQAHQGSPWNLWVGMYHWCQDIPGEFMQADMIGNVNVNWKEILLNYWQNLIQMHTTTTFMWRMGKESCTQGLVWLSPDSANFLAHSQENCWSGALKWTPLIAKNAQHSGMLMISKYHASNKNVVTQVLDLLHDEFGQEAPLTITRDRKLHYVGMHTDYTNWK